MAHAMHEKTGSFQLGFAQPRDPELYGYLSEHHSFGETAEKAGEKAEEMAASMLASTMGIEFKADESWDDKEQLFKLSGKFVKTINITQSAVGDKDGLWTTVIAAAVFVLGENNNDSAAHVEPKDEEAKAEDSRKNG